MRVNGPGLRSLLALVIFLVSCQTGLFSRKPASTKDSSLIGEYYDLRLRIRQISDLIDTAQLTLKTTPKNSPGHSLETNNLNNLLHERETLRVSADEKYKKLQALKTPNVPLSIPFSFDTDWRQHNDELIVHNLDGYPLQEGQIVKKMFLSTATARSFFLQLTQFTYSWENPNLKNEPMGVGPENYYLNAELTCDQKALLHLSPGKIEVSPGRLVRFKWYDSKLNAQRASLELFHHETRCELLFSKPDDNKKYGLRLVPETAELAALGNPQLQSELCYLPKTDGVSGIAKFFLSANIDYTTCPTKVPEFKTLEESTEGINAKVKVLIGQDLPPGFIKKADPFAPLDFSRAPKLDAILISYLVFRADFGGHIILQALKHHAERGTMIRIALSDVISLGKDRQMLLDFQAAYPNVKLFFYKYRPQGKGLSEWLSSLHRTNHIKLFLTYSASDEKANKVILGGRNIHDGFVFDQPSSNYIYPTVVNYASGGDEAWAHWEDFETLFTSKDLVQTIMGQFFSVLHADYSRVHIRGYTESIESTATLDPNYFQDNQIYIRSLVSIPFKDERLLERTYIQMIDSAEKLIKVSTPYFNLSKGLMDAFNRAVARGVHIELITRLDLKGDTADIVLSDVNKEAVNKFYEKIKIYEYTTKGKILHSKLFLIDNQFVMMGSVNLNLRSFFHDIENATFVYGPSFNRKIDTLYESYKKEAKLLTEKQKTTFWKKVLIDLIGTAL